MTKKTIRKQSQFRLKPACAALLLAFAVQTTQANPIGASVVNGQASFATVGNTLTVTNTPGAIINWQGFSIGANEITRFAQQSASSAVLNRVISNNPSSILGALQSNGRVFLVNPNGIVFGQGSTINVAGLVATSLNLSNADFIARRYNFTDVPGAQNISNAGNLTAQTGGQIYLIAPNVENTGIITAPNGEILLAAGHSVELVNSNDPNLRVSITAPAGDVTNVGKLVAEAGSLGLFGTVVKNSGTVSADSATLQGGKIVFKASQRAEAGGVISAQGVGGGEIKVLADMQTGTVNVSGTLDASAPNSGDGGFIETSAAQVKVADTARITTAAPNGKTGTWLIDPVMDFTIAPTGGDTTGAAISFNLNTTDVVIQSISGAVAGNGDIFVSDSITKTATGAATTLTLQADSSIIVAPTMAISSSGSALNVVFNANTAGAGGAIVMNTGSSITSNGGNITLGGGTAGDGTGNAVGNATYITGVELLAGSSISAGGGHITLRGSGYAAGAGPQNMGVHLTGAMLGTAGTGKITIYGTGGGAANSTGSNRGVRFGSGSSVSSSAGDIFITGIGGWDGDGVQVMGASSIMSTSGNITLDGNSGDGGSDDYGVYVTASDVGAGNTVISTGAIIDITGTSHNVTMGSSNRGTSIGTRSIVETTGAGTIILTGNGGFDSDGLVVSNGALVRSANGTMTLTGTSGDGGTDNYGTWITAAGTTVTSTGSGNIEIFGTSIGTTGTGNSGLVIQSGAQVATSGTGNITMNGTAGAGVSDAVLLSGTPAGGVVNAAAVIDITGTGAVTQTGNLITTGGAIVVTADTNLTMGSTAKAQSPGNGISYTATNGSVQLGLLDAGAGSVYVTAGENITDGNGASNNIKAGYASLLASNADNGPGSIDVDTQVPNLYVDNWMVYSTLGQPNNPITVRNSGSPLTVSVYSNWNPSPSLLGTEQLTITNNNTINVGHIGGALNTTLTAIGASSDITVEQGLATLLSAGDIVLNAGRDILITHDYVDAGGTVTATAGRDIRIASVDPQLPLFAAPTYIQAANGIDLTMQTGGLYIDSALYPAYIATTSGNINVVTSTGFANNGGAGALSVSPTGRWLIYAPNPGSVTKNGLIPAFYQYNTAYPGTVAPTGSGFVYVSPLHVDAAFSGTLSSTYGTSPTATPGYLLRLLDLDSDDTATAAAITGSATYSNWPITSLTAAGSYVLQYVSGLSVSSFYSLTPGTSQTYTVNLAMLTINASLTGTAGKTYDGTNTATLAPGNFLLSGFVNTDSATVTKTTGTYASPNVGSGILVSTTLAPSDFSPVGSTNLSNYTLPTSASGPIGSITTAPLTVTANNASKTYNGLAYSGGNGVVYSGLVNGEGAGVLGGTLTYSGTSQGAVNAGSYLITPGGLTSSNYTISFVDGILTINPAALALLSVTANNASKTYGITLTFAGTEFTPVGLLGGDTIGSVTLTSPGAVNTANAGTYAITPSNAVFSGGNASNYTISYVNGQLTVNPASLMVAANARSKVYGNTDPALTYVASGLLFTDTLTGGLTRTTGENVGVYAITQGTLANPNYTISYTGNNLSITRAALTVAANNASKTYDAIPYSGGNGVTYTGLTHGDSAAALGGTLTYGGTSQGAVNAGSYVITPGGLTSGNYTISYVDGKLTITPAALSLLSVTANNASKTYGTTLTFAGTEFTPVGLLGGDTLSGVTLTSPGAVNTANAGIYAITPSNAIFSVGHASNYTLSYVNGQLTVNPAALTLSANAQSKVYGNTDPALTYVASGLLFTDTLTGGLTRTTGENVGTYAITQGTLSNPNYTINYTGNNLGITPAALTVAANALSKTAGNIDPLLTYMVTGLKLADTEATTLSGALARLAGETAGVYPINQGTLTLLSTNYTMNYIPADFSILAQAVTPTLLNNLMNDIVVLPHAPTDDATTDADEKKKDAEADAQDADALAAGPAPAAAQMPVCK